MWKSRLLALAFMASLTVHADSCDDREFGLDEQEFLCDEASARMLSCCGRGVGLYCTRSYGCNYRSPDLPVSASSCIAESSCEEIVSAGLCQISDWEIDNGANYDAGPSPAYVALRGLPCY